MTQYVIAIVKVDNAIYINETGYFSIIIKPENILKDDIIIDSKSTGEEIMVYRHWSKCDIKIVSLTKDFIDLNEELLSKIGLLNITNILKDEMLEYSPMGYPKQGMMYPQQPMQPQQPMGFPQQPMGYPKQSPVKFSSPLYTGVYKKMPEYSPMGYPKQGMMYPQQPMQPQQPTGFPQQPMQPQQPMGFPQQPMQPQQPMGFPQQPMGYPQQPMQPQQPTGFPQQPISQHPFFDITYDREQKWDVLKNQIEKVNLLIDELKHSVNETNEISLTDVDQITFKICINHNLFNTCKECIPNIMTYLIPVIINKMHNWEFIVTRKFFETDEFLEFFAYFKALDAFSIEHQINSNETYGSYAITNEGVIIGKWGNIELCNLSTSNKPRWRETDRDENLEPMENNVNKNL